MSFKSTPQNYTNKPVQNKYLLNESSAYLRTFDGVIEYTQYKQFTWTHILPGLPAVSWPWRRCPRSWTSFWRHQRTPRPSYLTASSPEISNHIVVVVTAVANRPFFPIWFFSPCQPFSLVGQTGHIPRTIVLPLYVKLQHEYHGLTIPWVLEDLQSQVPSTQRDYPWNSIYSNFKPVLLLEFVTHKNAF